MKSFALMLITAVITSTLLFAPRHSTAQVNSAVANGALCDALDPTQTRFLLKRATGLENISLTTDVFVVCPTISISETPVLPRPLLALVTMTNNNTFPVNAICALREVTPDGVIVFTRANSFTMNAFGSGAAIIELPSFLDILDTATLVCLLPLNSQINGIIAITAG